MIDLLLGVPGKLKSVYDHLSTYLSSTRCAKIDNLDAAVTTRAAASTALSTADWTPARAVLLDNISPVIGAPPKLSGLIGYDGATKYLGGAGTVYECVQRMGLVVSVATVNNTYKTLLSVTGSGELSFLTVLGGVANTVGLTGIRITIDGVVVAEITSAVTGDGTYGYLYTPVGFVAASTASPPVFIAAGHGAPVPFETSLLVEVKSNQGVTGPTITGYYAMRRVS